MATTFYDELMKCLPTGLRSYARCLGSDNTSKVILDSILRFALLGEQSGDAAAKSLTSLTCPHATWASAKIGWRKKVVAMMFDAPVIGQKRPRDDDSRVADGRGSSKKAKVAASSSKKAKVAASSSKKANVARVKLPNDDDPFYTLHGIYCPGLAQTALDITVGARAIYLTTSQSQLQDIVLTRGRYDFKYAVLLTGPYYAMALIGKKTEGKKKSYHQIFFELNPIISPTFKITSYCDVDGVTITTHHHPNHTSLLDLLLRFSSKVPGDIKVIDASRPSQIPYNMEKFYDSHPSLRTANHSEKHGITAFLRDQGDGHIYLFSKGILWVGVHRQLLLLPFSAIQSIERDSDLTLHMYEARRDSSEIGGGFFQFTGMSAAEDPGIQEWIFKAEPRLRGAKPPTTDIKEKAKLYAHHAAKLTKEEGFSDAFSDSEDCDSEEGDSSD